MNQHYHAIVWIGHHEARVFHFSANDVERLVYTRIIRPDISITRQTQSEVDMTKAIETFFKQ